MNDKKQTKDRILTEAMKEFLVKGYEQASLRSICKKAECTTGAMYFFFKDKNDLFGALVKPQVDTIKKIVEDHYILEMQEIEQIRYVEGQFTNYNPESDVAVMFQVCSYIYENFDSFTLLLTKAVGSTYENFVDYLIEFSHKHYRKMADYLCQTKGIPNISEHIIHWTAHMSIEMFTQLVEHNVPADEAKPLLIKMMNFMITGWFSMFTES